jgi:chromosome segregation ATPase
MAENNQLGDEMRDAQEKLRLSASQIGKINNELKIACNEIEALQKRIQGMGDVGKRAAEYENKVAVFSQEIERLNGVIEKKNNEIRSLNEQLSEMDNLSRQFKGIS